MNTQIYIDEIEVVKKEGEEGSRLRETVPAATKAIKRGVRSPMITQVVQSQFAPSPRQTSLSVFAKRAGITCIGPQCKNPE